MTSLTPESQSLERTQPPQPLLDLVENDDRGTVYTAVETLYCESFDCHVPIIVLPTNQEIPEDRAGLGGYPI